MGHMRQKDTQPYEQEFWAKNRIDLVHDHVNKIDFDQKELHFKEAVMSYDKLILALGSKSNKFGWPGQDLEGVGGLYHLQDLENMERYSKNLSRAVIVGGGLIGIEMAEMFVSRNIPVTMLVREESYWNNVLPSEESSMISKHIKHHGIDLKLASNLDQIIDDGTGKAVAVLVKETGEKIDCGYVGLTAGVSPNVGFLANTGIDIGRGIKVNQYLETSIPDVYAIGDCAEQQTPMPGRRAVEAIWYTGRMMGETVAYNICDQKIAYDPGIWFNSAKFLDIEYQVYGTVLAKPPTNHASIYWEDKQGEKSIRLVYDVNSKEILGFNLMGIRYRHEVCEQWLREKTNIESVLQSLSLANFDPEFYKMYESELIQQYNKQTGKNIQSKSTRSWNLVHQFLKG